MCDLPRPLPFLRPGLSSDLHMQSHHLSHLLHADCLSCRTCVFNLAEPAPLLLAPHLYLRHQIACYGGLDLTAKVLFGFLFLMAHERVISHKLEEERAK